MLARAERRQRLAVGPEVAALTDAAHLGPHDAARPVDEERAAQGEAVLVVEHPVAPRHLAVRPEVRQQREEVTLGVGPRAQRVHRVARDREDLDVTVLEVLEPVADLAQLPPADPGERGRVEDDDGVLEATHRRQADVDAVLVHEGEVGGQVADPQRGGRLDRRLARVRVRHGGKCGTTTSVRAPPSTAARANARTGTQNGGPTPRCVGQRRGPLGGMRRVAAHSAATLTCPPVVRPAVEAASSTTLASTWPGRPALGVSSTMKPWSKSFVSPSTMRSTRSSSPSRYQSSTPSAPSLKSSSSSSVPMTSSSPNRRSLSTSSS